MREPGPAGGPMMWGPGPRPRGPSADGVWDITEVHDLGDVPHTPTDPDELEA